MAPSIVAMKMQSADTLLREDRRQPPHPVFYKNKGQLPFSRMQCYKSLKTIKFYQKKRVDGKKNISSAAKTRTKKRAGVAVYNRASSLGALVGHLYLTNRKRLDEIMLKLSFSADGPTKLILSDADGK